MRTKRKVVSFSDMLKHPASASLSHGKRALSLTIGFYLGLFPVPGCTTALCIAACLAFRLNSFLVLAMNVLLAPVQLLLMFPLIKFGQILFFGRNQTNPEFNWRNFYQTEDLTETLYRFLEFAAGGIFLWAFVSFLSVFFVYTLFFKYGNLLVK